MSGNDTNRLPGAIILSLGGASILLRSLHAIPRGSFELDLTVGSGLRYSPTVPVSLLLAGR